MARPDGDGRRLGHFHFESREHIVTKHRDAVSGEYVTEEYAIANPDTTVSETDDEDDEA
jgi:hypothetical protein